MYIYIYILCIYIYIYIGSKTAMHLRSRRLWQYLTISSALRLTTSVTETSIPHWPGSRRPQYLTTWVTETSIPHWLHAASQTYSNRSLPYEIGLAKCESLPLNTHKTESLPLDTHNIVVWHLKSGLIRCHCAGSCRAEIPRLAPLGHDGGQGAAACVYIYIYIYIYIHIYTHIHICIFGRGFTVLE